MGRGPSEEADALLDVVELGVVPVARLLDGLQAVEQHLALLFQRVDPAQLERQQQKQKKNVVVPSHTHTGNNNNKPNRKKPTN